MNRSSLIPSPEERFDVTQIFMAPMAEVCKSGAASLAVADFEKCVSKLRLHDGQRTAAFRSIAIPTIDDAFSDRVPTLRTLLKQQGHPDLEKSLLAREPYVIGMRIPVELLRQNQVGVEPNMLVYDGLQDARICLDGRCPAVVSKYEQSLLLFPLVVAELPKGEAADVFFFGKDTVFAYGPIIESGFYVTAASKLYTTKKLFPILAYGRSIILATLFIGLFLMAFGFAAIWSEFLDYGAFCYLTASFALYTIAGEPALARLKDWTVLDYYQLKVVAQVNLLAAFVAFGMATNRTSAKKVFATLIAIFVAGAGYMFWQIPRANTQETIRWSNEFEQLLVWLTLLAPVSLISYGGIRCYLRFLAAKRSGPLSLRLDFKRRTAEQAIYALFIFGVSAQLLMATTGWQAGTVDPSRFVPSTGFLLFGIFAVIIYHSTAKLAKTHFRADGISEAARLKGRLTTKSYHSWLAEARQGIMMQVDVKNSSVASSSLKSKIHLLMQNLNEAMKKSHADLGYHWMLAKKNGDEWIVILSAKHKDLEADLEEIVAASRRDAHDWKRLVQDMAPECSLHINVFALTSYSLGGEKQRNAKIRSSTGNWEVVDFASREANYLMKWAGKSARRDSLTVGASYSLFSEPLLSAAVSTARVSNLIAASGDTNAESVLDADSMSLMLACLPWQAREESSDAA